MLVLTRKEGDAIFIGDNITINVNMIKGRQVKLAVDAPKDIKILRAELMKGIKQKTFNQKEV